MMGKQLRRQEEEDDEDDDDDDDDDEEEAYQPRGAVGKQFRPRVPGGGKQLKLQ